MKLNYLLYPLFALIAFSIGPAIYLASKSFLLAMLLSFPICFGLGYKAVDITRWVDRKFSSNEKSR